MLIIADSSALVALALCDGLALLDQLFDEIKVPQAVYDEVVIEGKPEARTLQAYLQGKIIPVLLSNVVITGGGLGQGELEAMALYKAICADYMLVDDSRARKVARLNKINVTGSQGVLLLAKNRGLISQVKPYLDKLRQTDIRISDRLIQRMLKLAECMQVWFSGSHSDIGGSYKPDKDGSILADNSLNWMIQAAQSAGLTIEAHLKQNLKQNPLATLHNSRRSFYRLKQKYHRPILQPDIPTLIHESVKTRYLNDEKYRPQNLIEYLSQNDWPELLAN